MKLMVWKLAGFAAVLAAVVAAFGAVGTAHASHLSVRVSEPTAAVAGQPSEVDAVVTSADTGKAVAGAPVTFYVHGSFGKVSGYMEIGHAVTNAQGIATVSYVPREGGDHEVRVQYTDASGGTSEQTTGTVAVDGSPSQLHVQKAGIQVPGMGSWLIIVVLSTVWAILFGIALTLLWIARAGRSDGAIRQAGGTPRSDRRSVVESGAAGGGGA